MAKQEPPPIDGQIPIKSRQGTFTKSVSQFDCVHHPKKHGAVNEQDAARASRNSRNFGEMLCNNLQATLVICRWQAVSKMPSVLDRPVEKPQTEDKVKPAESKATDKKQPRKVMPSKKPSQPA
jgi:hypothetical protein